jgi:hypothetical protein
MTELMQASRQWSSRAPDERFTSLLDMQAFKHRVREASRSHLLSSRKVNVLPVEDDPRGLQILGGSLAAAARMACHTCSGVAGISIWRTPNWASASTMALITAASAGVPPSPPERTPSLFVGVGTSLGAVAKNGSVSARGIA